MGMHGWGGSGLTDSCVLEGVAVALAAGLAASAIRADLDFVWQTISILFTL